MAQGASPVAPVPRAARGHEPRFMLAPLGLLAFVCAGCLGAIGPSREPQPGGGGSADPAGSGVTNLPPATGGSAVTVGGVAIDPGRVGAHRLNRVEYANTVRDLFYGLDIHPADDFPVDTYAEGFDNNADELRMSNLLMEKYLGAATNVVTAAFADPGVASQLVPCDAVADGGCPARAIGGFLARAYRRTVTADERAPYLKLVDLARTQGDSATVGIQLALQAALVAPAFLFRIEPDPPAGTTRALSDFEIASRLSYFLWSSMPDDELLARGQAGQLHAPVDIQAEVARMLDDGKAATLVDNLAGEWFFARQLPELTPDPTTFPPPAFDEPLRAAMRDEMTLFLKEILLGQHSALELLSADFTFANRRLATHYGLPNASRLGDAPVRVALTGTQRGGLLTQAGWLMVTSHPDSSSPTKRGKWIMANLLCQDPPPPPPGVGNLPKNIQPGSRRSQLAQHAVQPACKACHQIIDPPGLALEHYDAIGRWRDTDGGFAIDSTGTLPGTNVTFDGPATLAQALAQDPRLPRCLTQKLLTYALGRGMQAGDAPALDQLAGDFARGGYRVRDLLTSIALSPLMTRRGGARAP